MAMQVGVEPGIWESFLCAGPPPPKLLDKILGAKLQFYEAPGRLTAMERAEMNPLTILATHVVDQDLFPGVARFPVDDWITEGRPRWSEASFVALCMEVCRDGMANLGAVFESCAEAVAVLERPICAMSRAQTDNSDYSSGAGSSPSAPLTPLDAAVVEVCPGPGGAIHDHPPPP